MEEVKDKPRYYMVQLRLDEYGHGTLEPNGHFAYLYLGDYEGDEALQLVADIAQRHMKVGPF